MDLTDLIPGIPALLEELEDILAGLTAVACLEPMKWLGDFMCISPVQRSLVGAATKEEEGFRLVERQRPLAGGAHRSARPRHPHPADRR